MKLKHTVGLGLLSLMMHSSFADNMANYQRISQNIPKMEMKADEQAHAWARSARTILAITNESIAETLLALNKQAAKQGRPFFCLPPKVKLNAKILGQLIANESQSSASQQDLDKTTVSQMALDVVMQKYPCSANAQGALSALSQTHAAMQHVGE